MKEGKVFKRILAVALVVVMTITMMPFGVFAADDCGHMFGFVKVKDYKAPSCTVAGNIAYYECDMGCGTLATDKNGSNIITVEETIIPAAHTEEIVAAVESTCSETGLTEGKKCSVCG